MKTLLAIPLPALVAIVGLFASSIGHGRTQVDATVQPACRAIMFEGSRFTICRASAVRHRLVLVDVGHDGRPIRGFGGLPARLGPDSRRIAFAMNAGMFDMAGYPIGLHVEEGREQTPLSRRDGSGNFHLKPNGVFYGDGKGWHVAATDTFAAKRPASLVFATQSGPMLVIDGKLHPRFDANGSSLHIRNGVGVDAKGDAQFAISEEPVSFGRFARLFRDGLGCRNALYLDGSISRLWDPPGKRRDGGVPIGPIVVALQKP